MLGKPHTTLDKNWPSYGISRPGRETRQHLPIVNRVKTTKEMVSNNEKTIFILIFFSISDNVFFECSSTKLSASSEIAEIRNMRDGLI